MNTLSRAITAQIFPDQTSYQNLRLHWSALVNSERKHELGPTHHLLYQALRGKDWRKAFTPITNQRKLKNGAFYDWGLQHALRLLHSQVFEEQLLTPFAGLVTPTMLQSVRSLVPPKNFYSYYPEAFKQGSFPFDAYLIPETFLAQPANKDTANA